MKSLAYVIIPEKSIGQFSLPRGPNGQPLVAVAWEGLAVLSAQISESAARPPVPELLAYARVIEELHVKHSVLPMRHGCIFDDDDSIRDFLRSRHANFRALLNELHGCSEMSLRILTLDPVGRNIPSPQPALTGAAYLADRRNHYSAQEQGAVIAARLSDQTQTVFRGLYRECRLEEAISGGRSLVRVHFLVCNERTDAFKAAFLKWQPSFALPLHLTGPWPPYNFADDAQRRPEK